MWVRRPRFKIWKLMIAMAGVGAVLGVSVALQRRQDRFLSLAKHHEACSAITWACGKTFYSATNALGEDVRTWSREKITWHRQLGEKYRRASSRPWIPVEVDPPAPQ